MTRATLSCWLAATLLTSTGALAQEPTLPVPETIRADGVPPIPARVRHELNRYQNIRSARFQDWAANGRGMYVITRFADVPQVHLVTQPGGVRTQLTFFPERVLSVKARPKHDEFLYMVDEGGAENYQLFLQALSRGQARRLTDGKSRNSAPAWSPSGELLAWSGNARNGRDMDLYVTSPLDPHFVRRFKEVSGQWTVSDWSPDESRVVVTEAISINESYIHTIDLATGATEAITPRPADPKTEPVSASDPKWSKDGKSLYYLTDKGSEFRRLVRHDLASGKVEVKTAEIPWDVEEFDLTDDGELIILVTNENGISRVHRLDLLVPNQSVVTPGGLPAGQISDLKLRPGSSDFAFTLSAARIASDAYVGSLSSNLTRWTLSETGGLDPAGFSEPAAIAYTSFDGRKIPAIVYRPSGRKFPGRRPVLMDIHGGPEGQSRPTFLNRLNYFVDELGLVLIFPNVRGSSGYGKTYLKLDNGELRADAVKDIGALFDWIAAQPDLDASRVGVTGGSYGGFMSLAVQTEYNDRIKAGIDLVGISNFVTFLQNTQSYRRDLRRAEYGDEREPAMRSFLERISPLAHAAKIRTPILVVAGKNDPRVPVTESAQMVAAVKRNGAPVWYVVGKNEGHGFAKKVNQDYLQAVEVEFLRRYLLGSGDQQAGEAGARYPVSGIVTLVGEPIAAGTIEFHPAALGGRRATGSIRDGRYVLTTVDPDDGALPGTYVVTVSSAAAPETAKVPARYAAADQSPLRCTIQPRANTINFDLN
jgi:dipeptidyl aminopeptidase/acylaminoacyl peptidase